MGKKNHLSRRLIAAALFILPQSLLADAWTQPAGHGQFIFNFTGAETSYQFDAAGRAKPFGSGGRFRKIEFNPYFEYGLNSKTTLIVNAFVPALTYSNIYGSQSSFGLGDVEIGVRRRLNSTESAAAISGQFSVLFPAYSSSVNPAPGNHQADLEARLLAGRGFELRHHHGFLSAGAAYRKRAGLPVDQFRSDASVGLDLNRRFMVIAQYSGITALQSGQRFDPVNNPNAQLGFDLYKAQISLVTSLTRSTRLQCGWIDAFAGRNTGNGQTFLLALWRTF